MNKKLSFGICVVLIVLAGIMYSRGPQSTKVPRTLVELKTYGGLCQYGLCTYTLVIYDNSRITKEGPVYNEATKNYENKTSERKISPEQLNYLIAKIDAEDLNKVKQRKFEGTCPVAYDGSASIYTIYKNGGKEVLDSCQYILDQILFKTIDQIRFDFAE